MLQNDDEPGDQGGRDGQDHADEGALDMEPVVVISIDHVLGPLDHEMLVMAEPQAIQDDRIEPVHDAPERVGGKRAAPECRAAIDIPYQQAEQDTEDQECDHLLRVEPRSARTVGIVHQPEGLAPLDNRRGIVENRLHRVPGHQEHEKRENRAGYEGFEQESHL